MLLPHVTKQIGPLALIYSTYVGDVELLSFLLNHPYANNLFLHEALLISCSRCAIAVVEILLEYVDHPHNLALIIAVRHGYYDLIKILMKFGVDLSVLNNANMLKQFATCKDQIKQIVQSFFTEYSGEMWYLARTMGHYPHPRIRICQSFADTATLLIDHQINSSIVEYVRQYQPHLSQIEYTNQFSSDYDYQEVSDTRGGDDEINDLEKS